ncbi:MAG: LytTR family DNA-binding domain-containing protein [Pseudomonadota bacterium]
MKNAANSNLLSFALRQLQVTLAKSIYWVIIGAAVFLTALAGPYFTLERMSFPERLVYWSVTIVFSAVLMSFLSILAFRLSERRGWHWVAVTVAAGLIGTAPVVGSLYLAEGVATGFATSWAERSSFFSLALYVGPSLIAVTLVVNVILNAQSSAEDAVETGPGVGAHRPQSLLQSKLPAHLGTDIISVQAQDHYVEVTTPKGRATVLMRLRDVVQDLEPLGGLQVHRSWWVRLSHIAAVEKTPNGPELLLSSDQRVLVGRSFRAAFREAQARFAQAFPQAPRR